ncbi:MAG: glycosyltransferase family 9 protein [Vicinamibacterales bacterium]
MKILLVRLRQIGDVVFTTPAFAALRDHFPAVHLTYLVEPAAASVVLGNPDLSEVIVAPRASGARGLMADLTLGRRLARERFDIALDFHGGPRASLLTWLSRAPRRIGYEVSGRAWMYTERVARPRELRARHSVENQWDLLTAIGVPPPDRSRYPVAMPLLSDASAHVRERLAAHGVTPASLIVVMHVSAGNPFRRWPLESFATVAAALPAVDPRVRVIVTSGPSEADAAAQVIRGARERLEPARQAQVLACGEFSLAELRALVEVASLYIGGDSGPMHVAATSRVPMVSLYGPTLPVRSEPWRAASLPMLPVEVHGLGCRPCDQRVCEPGDFRCLGRISPGQVVDAATQLLARNG